MHSSEGIVARPARSVAPPHRAHEAPTARQVFARTPSQTRPMLGRWTNLPIYTRRVLAVTALSFGLHAQALQVVEASDGVSVEAIVSLREPTRIRIEGMPVTDVFGNIHSSHCGSASPLPAAIPATTATAGGAGTTAPAGPINPAGDVVVECDRDKGEIYIRPVGDSGKPINLFVASSQATYTLLLRRADVPADTILIRDRTPRALRPAPSEPAPAGPSPSHLRTMKALLVAMASDRVPPDIRVQEASHPLQLWAEVKFSLLRLYEGRGYVGEKYALQNISAAPMVLAEQEFDRAGGRADDGEVVGVAIEHHNLRPGESTSVYVIRRGGAR